jgi:polysaccharide export outer membrane protein
VAGLSPKEVETELKAQLSFLVPGADIFVLIKEVHSEKVFVIGAVRKEGSIVLAAPMTVLQVLAEAGGLTVYAKARNIHILRSRLSARERHVSSNEVEHI